MTPRNERLRQVVPGVKHGEVPAEAGEKITCGYSPGKIMGKRLFLEDL